MKLPPPPKWSEKTDGIESGDFVRRAQQQERSLLPPDTVFPRTGQIWEAVLDCEVHVRRWIVGPKVPVLWIDGRLPEEERVRICELDSSKPLEVRFEPLRSFELSESIAPDILRYELWLRTARLSLPVLAETTAYFNELFRQVTEVV